MRRELRILLVTLLLALAWAYGGRVPRALASMDAFRVQDVEVSGLRHLTRAEVLEAMDVTTETSIWEDRDRWTAGLRAHPLVKGVHVRRRMPGTLVVRVAERWPVALVPTPTLEPVDAEGVRLALDPAALRLDLPVVAPRDPVAEGSRLVPASTRELLSTVGRLAEADTAFAQMVSTVEWRDAGTLVARWSEPAVDFLLRPDSRPERIRDGLSVLADAMGRGRTPTEIDLRYADQVVVRRTDHR